MSDIIMRTWSGLLMALGVLRLLLSLVETGVEGKVDSAVGVIFIALGMIMRPKMHSGPDNSNK